MTSRIARRGAWRGGIYAFALSCLTLRSVGGTDAVVWEVNHLDRIGGNPVTVVGAPVVTNGAVVFDGRGDGLFLNANPLEGMAAFTVEILFSPAADGGTEQRFLHLEDDAGRRLLIEIRLDGTGGWWLDTFLRDGESKRPLIDPLRVHRAGQWTWAALRYDGKIMAHYVNGLKEREGAVAFGPMTAGRTSLGVRQNRMYWYKGAIREVRFTRGALREDQLQRPGHAPAP